MFRTADAAGITHMYLSGYTSLPIDRFGRKRSDMNKIALGAEDSVSWEQIKSVEDFLKNKGEHTYIVAIEQDENSVSYNSVQIPRETEEVIIMMGEEVNGIEPQFLKHVDEIAEIPMRGKKESLNVSVAFGIAAYSLINR